MTLSDAKKIVAAVGCTLSKSDGEYRVNLRGHGEATAYYTNDLQDAVNTAKTMAARGAG
jgi:hypothetical protein